MPDIGLLQGAPPPRASPPPAVERPPAAAFTARVEAPLETIAARFAALPEEAIVVVSAPAPPVAVHVQVQEPVPVQAQPPAPPEAQHTTSLLPPVRSSVREVAPIDARDLLWLALALLVIIGTGIGIRDPWPADEPRFALVAKQMVESGNWLFPHRGIELYSDKPPMLMWLQAAFFELVRDWRVAFLLPSLLASLGSLWCVVDLGRRLWTRKVGLYAGWALLFALQFTYQAKKAQIDPLVTFWITLANYGLLRHFLSTRHDPEPDWKMWMLGWFAAGLGTITKGVGVLALAMLVPAMYASVSGWRNVRVPLRAAPALLGPLAFVAAASLWLVPMLAAALSQHDPA
jgi:4-amino-4-deoxy-L-arabinose transferase-like glycosyltransferase